MTPLHIETPLFHSPALSARSGAEIWLKIEALQPAGSFKMRGIGALCAHHAAAGKRRIISSSGGNAGIAAANAGRRLGMAVTVYVPETTTARARALIAAEGAKLVVTGASWAEANEVAMAAVDDQTAFVHPFDDPVMWDGHATMIDEVARQDGKFDTVVLSVGGGGLMLGVASGLARNGMADVPIYAVETWGAASLAASVAAGGLVALPAISSIATSLGARQVASAAFDLTRTRDIRPHQVSDKAAVSACLDYLNDHKLLVEPACGAALSMAYDPTQPLAGLGRVLIIVCGGVTTTLAQLEAWAAE